MLRSPTAEHVARLLGYSADSAGTMKTAIRPLTIDAINRAEYIMCMEKEHGEAVRALHPGVADRIYILGIPDNYEYCEPELVARLNTAIKAHVQNVLPFGAKMVLGTQWSWMQEDPDL